MDCKPPVPPGFPPAESRGVNQASGYLEPVNCNAPVPPGPPSADWINRMSGLIDSRTLPAQLPGPKESKTVPMPTRFRSPPRHLSPAAKPTKPCGSTHLTAPVFHSSPKPKIQFRDFEQLEYTQYTPPFSSGYRDMSLAPSSSQRREDSGM